MIRAAVLAMGLALSCPIVATAQVNCDTHARILIHLAEYYGETRQMEATGESGVLVETWANVVTGTWTITVTRQGGETCIVASGEDFALVNSPV